MLTLDWYQPEDGFLTVADLVAIIRKAPSLAAFLESPELMEDYYHGLGNYFGH